VVDDRLGKGKKKKTWKGSDNGEILELLL
jgi:hypothetical protein